MSENTLKVRSRVCTKTSTEWTTENPILLDGEIGYDSTSKRYKIGDGTTTWNELEYNTISGNKILTLFKSSTKTNQYNGTADLTITPSDVVGAMEDGTSTITDNTEFITSNTNGFNYSGSVNVPYRRKATYIWDWIKSKIETVIKPIIHRGSNTYVYSGDDSAKYSYQNWVNCLPFTDSNGDTRYALEILPGATETITYNGNTHTITNSRTTTIIVVLYARNTDIVQDISGTRARIKLKHNIAITSHITSFDINQDNADYDIVQSYASHADSKYSTQFKNACSVLVWFKSTSYTYNGNNSVASGYSSVASGNSSVASGYSSVASGNYSVASGNYSVASGYSSVASGNNSVASDESSIAMGAGSQATKLDSIAFGRNTIASTRYQAVFGTYNAETSDFFIIGNGNSSTRKNIFTISSAGKVVANGGYSIPNGTASQLLLANGTSNTLKTINNQSLLGSGNINTTQTETYISEYNNYDNQDEWYAIPFHVMAEVTSQEENYARLLSTSSDTDLFNKILYNPDANTLSVNIGAFDGYTKLINNVDTNKFVYLIDILTFFLETKDNLISESATNKTWLNTLCSNTAPTKSIATLINEAIAQVVANAPASFDTLKEIADWISTHQNDASAMNSAINTNTTNITNLTATVNTNTTNITNLTTKVNNNITAINDNTDNIKDLTTLVHNLEAAVKDLQAQNIALQTEINILKQNLPYTVAEDGFFVVDGNGYVGFKVDNNGATDSATTISTTNLDE